MSMRRASPSPSAPSSSSTRRRSSGPSSPTQPRPVATPQRCSESLTVCHALNQDARRKTQASADTSQVCRRATSTRLPPRSTGKCCPFTTQYFLTIHRVPGDDVIVAPSIKAPQDRELFPDFRAIKPYLRVTPLPKEKTTAA
ncbi:hypothetical protein MRB53_037003 [Persea americana]|nr:hypothetical protein MRB53_037003 [Persea americana]